MFVNHHGHTARRHTDAQARVVCLTSEAEHHGIFLFMSPA